LNSHYTHYASAKKRTGPRPAKEYLMTIREVTQAQKILALNLALQMSFAQIQAALFQYYTDLAFVLTCMERKHGTSAYRIKADRMAGASAIFSFLHDLLPVTALAMKENGWDLNSDLQPKDMHDGLALAFHKKGFSFMGADGYVMSCPFRRQIGHVFETVLEQDKDGKIRVVDIEIPGALPVFVADLHLKNVRSSLSAIPREYNFPQHENI